MHYMQGERCGAMTLPSERYGRAAAEDFAIRFGSGKRPEMRVVVGLIEEYFEGITIRWEVSADSVDIWLPKLPKERWQDGDGAVHEDEQSITVYLAAAHAGGAFTARANGPRHSVEALAAGFVVFVKEKLQ